MEKSDYKRFGDYIEPIDERNSKLEVKLSQGINNKYFQAPKQVAENSVADKSEYETLTKRIRLNEQMNHHLEATAQALYRKTFVDNIDKENLPEGWRMGTIGEFCKEIKSGGTPNRSHNQDGIKKLANGGAQENLSQELRAQQPILIISENKEKSYFVPILDNLIVRYKENEKLTELQSLLLAKMGQKDYNYENKY